MPTVVFGYVWIAGLTVNSAVGVAYTSTPTAVVSAHPYALIAMSSISYVTSSPVAFTNVWVGFASFEGADPSLKFQMNEAAPSDWLMMLASTGVQPCATTSN